MVNPEVVVEWHHRVGLMLFVGFHWIRIGLVVLEHGSIVLELRPGKGDLKAVLGGV